VMRGEGESAAKVHIRSLLFSTVVFRQG
jgi:hypothetical protein